MKLLTNAEINKLSLQEVNYYINLYSTELNKRAQELADSAEEMASEGLDFLRTQSKRLKKNNPEEIKFEDPNTFNEKELRAHLRALRNILQSPKSSLSGLRQTWQQTAKTLSSIYGRTYSENDAQLLGKLFGLADDNVPSEFVIEYYEEVKDEGYNDKELLDWARKNFQLVRPQDWIDMFWEK